MNNYKAFYRTYRPSNFDEVVGQEHIVRTLVNMLKNNKISHGYLFSGPRGTGKTSVAKIFANAINCIHAETLDGICKLCLDNANNSLDIIEIDAASNNGVDDIRNLREQINFAPTKYPYKVYIVDEVHMLSKGAFNSLLKTLEEPPAHAIFIFATTNPDKIPETILSRVQRYNFKRITKMDLNKQLQFVFNKEGVKFDRESVEMISSLANGSLRDALSIADQVSAYSNANIKKEDIISIFGLTSIDNQIKLVNYWAKKDVANALNYFNQLSAMGIDISKFVHSLINLLKDFLVFKKTNNTQLLEVADEDSLNKINLNFNLVYKILELLVPLVNEIKNTDIPQQLFQLATIQICSLEVNLEDVNKSKIIDVIDQTQPVSVEDKTNPNNEFNNNELENKNTNHNLRDLTNDFFAKEESKTIEPSTKKQSEEVPKFDYDNHFKKDANFVNVDNSASQEQNPFSTIEVANRFNSILHEQNSNPASNNIEQVNLSLNTPQFDTDELINNTTEILNVSNEYDGSDLEVQEDILDSTEEIIVSQKPEIYDTNEIDVNNKNTSQLGVNDETSFISIKNTEEFDLSNNEGIIAKPQVINEEFEYVLSQPNIVNLFLLAQKETFDIYKRKLQEASLSLEEKYEVYLILFRELKFICSSNDFVLVSANEEWVVEDVNKKKNEIKFREFVNKYFKTNFHFFAVNKKEYEQSKDLYSELRKSNQVPQAQPLPKINGDFSIGYSQTMGLGANNKDSETKAKMLFGKLLKKKE